MPIPKTFSVGLVALSAFLILFVGLSWLKEWSGIGNNHLLNIHFSDANGLIVGDPVFYRGVRIGKVEKISVAPERIEVECSFNPDVKIQSDAIARVGMLEILAGKKIDIIPGTSSEFLQSGDQIQGEVGADIPSMVFQLNKFSSDIQSVLEGLTQTLELTADPSFQSDIRNTIQNFNQASASLAETADFFNREKSDYNLTFQKIDQLVTHLNEVVDDLKPYTKSIGQKVDQNLDHLKILLSDLETILESFRNNQTLAGKLLNDPEFAVKFEQTLDSLNQLIHYIRNDRLKVEVDFW